MTTLENLIGSVCIAAVMIAAAAFIIYFGKALEYNAVKLGWTGSNMDKIKMILFVLFAFTIGIFTCSILPK